MITNEELLDSSKVNLILQEIRAENGHLTRNQLLDELFRRLGHYGPRKISQVLKINTTVQRVRLDNQNIGNEGAKHLAEALKVNNIITYLSLSMNGIGTQGAIELSQALLVNKTVEQFRLSDNWIGDDGADAFGRLLKESNSLKVLNLSACGIGPVGIKSISRGLTVNQGLVTLQLDENEFGDKGIHSLGKYLRANRVLRRLSVVDCGITDIGTEKFALDLENMEIAALRIVDLHCNRISNNLLERVEVTLATKIQTQKTREEIHLEENKELLIQKEKELALKESSLVRREALLQAQLKELDQMRANIGESSESEHDSPASSRTSSPILMQSSPMRIGTRPSTPSTPQSEEETQSSPRRQNPLSAGLHKLRRMSLASVHDLPKSPPAALSESNSPFTTPRYRSMSAISRTLPGGSFTCCVVGDKGCGKTSMLNKFAILHSGKQVTANDLTDSAMKFGSYTVENFAVDGKNYEICCKDTESDDVFTRFRTLNYEDADVFVILFSVVDALAHERVISQWYTELHFLCPDVPILLVGSKIDLRNGEDQTHISAAQGKEVAKTIQTDYFEVSLLDTESISKLFVEVVKLHLKKSPKEKGKKRPSTFRRLASTLRNYRKKSVDFPVAREPEVPPPLPERKASVTLKFTRRQSAAASLESGHKEEREDEFDSQSSAELEPETGTES